MNAVLRICHGSLLLRTSLKTAPLTSQLFWATERPALHRLAGTLSRACWTHTDTARSLRAAPPLRSRPGAELAEGGWAGSEFGRTSAARCL